MFIFIYNIVLIIKEFKTISLNLLSLNKMNNKFLLFLLLIIIIDMCYIFIFPVFIFNLLNYDKLVSFIENFYIFKSNNIKFKPYYMFPKDNSYLDKGKGKAKEVSTDLIITSNNKQVITDNKVNVNKPRFNQNYLTPKASTSKLDNSNQRILFNMKLFPSINFNLVTPTDSESTSKFFNRNKLKNKLLIPKFNYNLVTPTASTSNLVESNEINSNLLSPRFKPRLENVTPKASTSKLIDSTQVRNNLLTHKINKSKSLSYLKPDYNPNGYSQIVADYSDEDRILFKDLFTTKESIFVKAANDSNYINYKKYKDSIKAKSENDLNNAYTETPTKYDKNIDPLKDKGKKRQRHLSDADENSYYEDTPIKHMIRKIKKDQAIKNSLTLKDGDDLINSNNKFSKNIVKTKSENDLNSNYNNFYGVKETNANANSNVKANAINNSNDTIKADKGNKKPNVIIRKTNSLLSLLHLKSEAKISEPSISKPTSYLNIDFESYKPKPIYSPTEYYIEYKPYQKGESSDTIHILDDDDKKKKK